MLFDTQVCEMEICLILELIFRQSDNLEPKVFQAQLKNTTPEAECSQERNLENTREDFIFQPGFICDKAANFPTKLGFSAPVPTYSYSKH